MITPAIYISLWLVSILPGFAHDGLSGGPPKVLGAWEVAPAATVIPDRLVEDLLRPQVVYLCGISSRCRFRSYPEGRTYGQTAVRRLQRAWRGSRSPKPEFKTPQRPSSGTNPESRR